MTIGWLCARLRLGQIHGDRWRPERRRVIVIPALGEGGGEMAALRRYRSIVADSTRWEGFGFRPGDIVISTPPKCGTTWTQMLVALLVFGTAEFHRPLAEISVWLDMQLADRGDAFALLEQQEHRRFIKSHTPLDGLPDDDRVTYIAVGRDPRDVAVSAAHHMSNMDLARFLEVRERAVGLDDLAELGAPTPGSMHEPYSVTQFIESGIENAMSLTYLLHHLDTFWQQRDDPRVVLLHYADLEADLLGQMRRLADVLGIDISDRRLAELATAASFTAMKNNAVMVAPNSDVGIWRSTQDFFHRGSSGQWREAFDADTLRRYDERIAELASPDLAGWVHSGWLGSAAPTAVRV